MVEIVRQSLGVLFTAIAVSIVVSFSWFVFEVRREQMRPSVKVALALVMFFSGLICSQFYTLLVMRYEPDATTLTPFFPLAVLAVIGALGGGAYAAWVIRPRQVPVRIWLLGTLLSALALALARVYLL